MSDHILTRRLLSDHVNIYLESGLQWAASIPPIASVIVPHQPSAWFSTISELKHLKCTSWSLPIITIIKLSSGDHFTLVIASGKIKCYSLVNESESNIVSSLPFDIAKKKP